MWSFFSKGWEWEDVDDEGGLGDVTALVDKTPDPRHPNVVALLNKTHNVVFAPKTSG